MRKARLICAAGAAALAAVSAASAGDPLRVASFNPVMADIVRQVGGEDVRVVDLLEPGRNPHDYTPSSGDLAAARESDLAVAAGKDLETWLDDVRSSLAGETPIFEVGRMIPSLRVKTGDGLFSCCPSHASGAIDPHWWHSIGNASRAAGLVERKLAELDPGRTDAYARRADAFRARLDELENWARAELSRVPRAKRKLATAHAAFNYFCREFGWEAVPVQGLSTQQEPNPARLRSVIDTLRRENIPAVFPEVAANPKVMENMVQEAGVVIGGSLLAGSPPIDNPTYEAMMRHNVETIVRAMAPPQGREK
jgi:zinc/manganese transport system substrate-binding protein